VIPSKQLQVVQSLDGGVITEILVREGEVVEAGQRSQDRRDPRHSGVRESAPRPSRCRHGKARLRATPKARRSSACQWRGNAEEVRTVEKSAGSTKHACPSCARCRHNEQQLQQRRQELSEMRSRQGVGRKAGRVRSAGLAKDQALAGTGAVSEVDIIRIEREISRARGDADQAGAQIARVRPPSARRSERSGNELTSQRRAQGVVRSDGQAQCLNEGAVALADRVTRRRSRARARARAAASGNTVGGVVQTAVPFVEIVRLMSPPCADKSRQDIAYTP